MPAHIHKYKKLKAIKDYGTTDGRFIQRIILARECSCTDIKAFECGSPDKMRALWKRINEN